MRLSSIINLCLGLILAILMLVSFTALYQTRKSNLGLKTILDEHVPTLKNLLQSQELLNSTNLLFERYANVDWISFEEAIRSVEQLKLVVQRIEESGSYGEIHADETGRMVEKIQSLVKQSSATEINDLSSGVRREKSWAEIRQIVGSLRNYLRQWIQEGSAQQISENREHALEAFSNLLSIAETDLGRYYAQDIISLEQLLNPLSQCLSNLQQLERSSLPQISTFSLEDSKQMQDLSSSFRRYQSAIILYYDEEQLGVSGSNLDDVFAQVMSARETTQQGIESLRGSLLDSINTTQQKIITSSKFLEKLFLFVTVSGVLAVLGTSVVLSRTLSKRIHHLLHGAETIACGDLDVRLNPEPEGDPLSRLAIAFNSMADSLQIREAEKKEYLIKLAQAQKMEAIGLMASGIAHDLNNILSGIVGYPELLLMQLPKESELRRPLENIQDSGKRAADVVADLLTVARGVAARRETVNANTLIEEYLLSPECRKLFAIHSKVECEIDFDPELVNMACSPVHFKKCIMNLVTNAVEAINGAGKITISTRNKYVDHLLENKQELQSGEYNVICIRDTGPGIFQEDLRRIFEPFYTKKIMGKSGTGLGLAVVWNTVHDHDGSIQVESSDEGTIFSMYFPATKEALVIEEQALNIAELAGKGEKILIIDDEFQQRDIATQMLTLLGYNVESVSSGEGAVQYLIGKTVDLLVLDMVMEPGMSGGETYEQILTMHPGQKAIVASGFSVNDEMKKVRGLGISTYVKKPYTFKQLALAVKQVLPA
ncbi:MAG: response regulator [Proteobacteria bacterium]|nr:response regulator [Pseudomonadota bacterium]MBU1059436.1 response regulator [Pseudomonadota bacterium]